MEVSVIIFRIIPDRFDDKRCIFGEIHLLVNPRLDCNTYLVLDDGRFAGR